MGQEAQAHWAEEIARLSLDLAEQPEQKDGHTLSQQLVAEPFEGGEGFKFQRRDAVAADVPDVEVSISTGTHQNETTPFTQFAVDHVPGSPRGWGVEAAVQYQGSLSAEAQAHWAERLAGLSLGLAEQENLQV
jgi:hypothetical protein